jgi:hypothetical protein
VQSLPSATIFAETHEQRSPSNASGRFLATDAIRFELVNECRPELLQSAARACAKPHHTRVTGRRLFECTHRRGRATHGSLRLVRTDLGPADQAAGSYPILSPEETEIRRLPEARNRQKAAPRSPGRETRAHAKAEFPPYTGIGSG